MIFYDRVLDSLDPHSLRPTHQDLSKLEKQLARGVQVALEEAITVCEVAFEKVMWGHFHTCPFHAVNDNGQINILGD